jgi:hypothetical protein
VVLKNTTGFFYLLDGPCDHYPQGICKVGDWETSHVPGLLISQFFRA